MAHSTCAKCGNRQFELKEHSPVGLRYKVNFIQCSGCGSVAGVVDYFNVSTKIETLEQKLDSMNNFVQNNSLQNHLAMINRSMAGIHQILIALAQQIAESKQVNEVDDEGFNR
jgi:hypothetical protein